VNQNEINSAAPKLEWVRPELQRIEAGSAESLDGGNPDGDGLQES
jgi:hypothetical protein